MTKKRKVSSPDQPTLFDWVRESANPAPARGTLDVEKELKCALSEDIRHAVDDSGRELSRAQVAARMTDFLGEEVTLSILNNWTATSHPHSLPASYLPAFIRATGGQRRAAEVISRHSGLFLLPGAEALRAEIRRLEEDLERIKAEKQKRLFFLKELEGR
jgi:hypothetical protein